MKRNLYITVAIVALITTVGISSTSVGLNAVMASNVPVTGGLCPEGHECICNPTSGVFSDLTTGDRINTDCGQEGGEVSIPSGQGLCPEGHECICTPATGVFHDLTANVNINTGCTGASG